MFIQPCNARHTHAINAFSAHQFFYCILLELYLPINSGRVPSGFGVPIGFGVQNEQDTVVILFKAVLFKAAWTWDEKTSNVYIRFLHKELGDMKYDYGTEHLNTRYSSHACMHGISIFQQICIMQYFNCHYHVIHAIHNYRDEGADYVVISIKVIIKRSVINFSRTGTCYLQYKYSVVGTSSENPLEYLHGVPHGTGYTNRVLKLTKEHLQSGGMHLYKLCAIKLST